MTATATPTPFSSSSSPPSPLREEVEGRKGEGREGEGRGRRGIEIIKNVGNRPPGKRVMMKKRRKNMDTSNTTTPHK